MLTEDVKKENVDRGSKKKIILTKEYIKCITI